MEKHLDHVARALVSTRPTAVNLVWAVERIRQHGRRKMAAGSRDLRQEMEEEALRIPEEDLQACREMGRQGQILIPDGGSVLTHCNAGALATAGYGTALGVIRAAREAGKRVHVYVDETRPFLQGSRLTAWELMKDRIPCTLITDNMAGYLMAQGRIDLVVVGSDRIAANGDVANKIGTYSVAVLAREHGIPFYAVAPTSTFDLTLASGGEIPTEERRPEEVTHVPLSCQRGFPLEQRDVRLAGGRDSRTDGPLPPRDAPGAHEGQQRHRHTPVSGRTGEGLWRHTGHFHDYGVMEKSDRIYVIRGYFGWTDLGSWDEVWTQSGKDPSGNSITGKVIQKDTSNSLIYSPDKMVATVGVEDLIIVNTDDALLICRRGRTQDVKEIADYLRRKQMNEYL